MIFKERQKRAMDTMNHRNKEYLEKMNGPLPDGGEENQEIPVRQVDDNPFSKDINPTRVFNHLLHIRHRIHNIEILILILRRIRICT